MSLFTLQTADQQQYGPVEMETLRAWTREGRIEAANFIYDHTHLKWIEAASLPEIMDFFVPRPQPEPAASHTAEEDNSQHRKDSAEAHAQSDDAETSHTHKTHRTSSTRLKVPREAPRTHHATSHGGKGHDSKRKTSVLGRFSRIFPNPFSKKKGHTQKKQTQRIR